MKALRFKNGQVAVDDVPVPRREGETLVRVILSGICNTDLEIVRGYAGFQGTIGHEFVGVVEEAEEKELVGKRVVGEINAGCGRCSRCQSGDPRHCSARTVLGIVGRDGCHAEYLSLPAVNLLEVPDEVSDRQAVFAEPLAAAFGIGEQVSIKEDTKLGVIGDGKLGLLCAMSLRLKTKDLTAIGKHKSKLAILSKYGIETKLLSEIGCDIRGSFDVVVEASGSESGFATALDLVKPRGKIVLKSTFNGTPTWAASRVVVDEITIVGSRCGRFAPALDILSNGGIDVEDLINDEMPLSDGVRAIGRAREKGTLKILLRP
jgi:threonine dehydrogenase-like Zn-dependent dehydrogenase